MGCLGAFQKVCAGGHLAGAESKQRIWIQELLSMFSSLSLPPYFPPPARTKVSIVDEHYREEI